MNDMQRDPLVTARACLAVLGLMLPMLMSAPARADVCAVDDSGQEVCLDKPASRIAALSPGASGSKFGGSTPRPESKNTTGTIYASSVAPCRGMSTP